MKKKLLTTLLVALLILLAAVPALGSQLPMTDLEAAKLYCRLYAFYPLGDEVQQAKSLDSLEQALQAYDPYAYVMNAEELAAFATSYNDSYVGIGVLLAQREDGAIYFQAIYGDSVADRANFRQGDVLYSVDGVRMQGKTLAEAQAALSGDPAKLVTVVVERNGVQSEMMMSRKEMSRPSLSYWLLDGGVAYLQIDQFTVDTADQVQAGLDYLRRVGMKSLLLDLRDCPGGVIYTAADVAALFSGVAPVYFSLDKQGYDSFYASGVGLDAPGLPLAVLVNENTASAAELLAASIQDNACGSVIGVGTHGKGCFQSVLSLPSGGGLYLTTGKYVTIGMQDIMDQGGVTPDLLVREPAAQMTAAQNWLLKQQAVPSELRLTVNSNFARADGVAYTTASSTLLRDGVSYVPAAETLTKLGWELHYHQGQWYGFNGARRVILDYGSRQAVSGGHQAELLLTSGVYYLPASYLRYLGLDVSWDNEAAAVVVQR